VKVCETRARGIEDLAWLQTDLRQGEPIDALPVYVTVSCGRPTLVIGDVSFQLATWQVLIRLDLDNASVKFRSHRKVKVQKGAFQSQSTSKKTLLTIREHARALDLEARAKSSVSSVVAGSLLANVKLGRSSKQVETGTDTTKITKEIVLIGPFGEAVAVGDPEYGDPHKPNGLLTHDYPKDEGEEDDPLFTLQPTDSSMPMRISVMTVVPFDKLYLSSPDASAFERNLARHEIVERSKDAIEEHEELRRQMFQDEFVDRISRNQKRAGLPVRDGEFAVMIESFEVRPIAEGTEGGTEGR
jgi:hypothetical protein